MANNTITEGVSLIMNNESIPIWVRLFALIGMLYVFQSVIRSSSNIFVGGAYIVGFIKYIYKKLKQMR